MKVGIVSASFLASERRWNAGHYLGRVKDAKDEVRKATQHLLLAKNRLRRAKQAVLAEQRRSRELLNKGLVREIV